MCFTSQLISVFKLSFVHFSSAGASVVVRTAAIILIIVTRKISITKYSFTVLAWRFWPCDLNRRWKLIWVGMIHFRTQHNKQNSLGKSAEIQLKSAAPVTEWWELKLGKMSSNLDCSIEWTWVDLRSLWEARCPSFLLLLISLYDKMLRRSVGVLVHRRHLLMIRHCSIQSLRPRSQFLRLHKPCSTLNWFIFTNLELIKLTFLYKSTNDCEFESPRIKTIQNFGFNFVVFLSNLKLIFHKSFVRLSMLREICKCCSLECKLSSVVFLKHFFPSLRYQCTAHANEFMCKNDLRVTMTLIIRKNEFLGFLNCDTFSIIACNVHFAVRSLARSPTSNNSWRTQTAFSYYTALKCFLLH